MSKRYWVNVTMEIFVPEQGCGEKATKNENRDARWFADTIAEKKTDIAVIKEKIMWMEKYLITNGK